jgi:protein-tyrosine phosphatase
MTSISRSVPLSGASNFRDLGGYAGHAGRTVAWRKLFRSDHLGLLSGDDIAQINQLNVARVLDFRGAAERTAQVCAIPGARVSSLAIEPTVVQAITALVEKNGSIRPEDAVALMQQTYRAFVHDNSARFAELFAHLLEDDAPLVFHCTAGKDRTGFAAALVLRALGVSESVVMQDYLLTNELFRPPELVGSHAPPEVRNVIARVQTGFLDAAFEAVASSHGSVEQYLEKAMRLGSNQQQRLRSLYLQTSVQA